MNKYHNEYYNFGNLGVSFRMLKFIVNQKNLNATLNSRNSYDLHKISQYKCKSTIRDTKAQCC